jgi:ribosome-associated protein|tara:strand:- start:435 stop:866 length:432 start_codon:yes stop_codon:yes gene_type:complete
MNDITINKEIKIPFSELTFEFFRSSGPGGQHVNKVETGVRLRFDINNSENLSERMKIRLFSNHQGKITRNGELLVESTTYKSQHQNKQEVIKKFRELLILVTKKEKKRIKTFPTKSSVEKRISKKKKRGEIKKLRRKPEANDS